MRARLLEALEEVKFEENELVYLALNSKAERQVVDRLAWRLQSKEELDASREWKRCDLAIFEKGEETPVALLEAKAFSSFAAVHQSGKYPAQVSRDVDKARALRGTTSSGDAEIYVLLVMTHVEKPPAGEKLGNLVKYPVWFRNPVEFAKARSAVVGSLNCHGARVDHVLLQEGEIQGVRTRVDAWLCGPIGSPSADDNWSSE